MNIEDLEYALAKQLSQEQLTLIIDTDYGELFLEGDEGRKAVKAIRRILMMSLNNQQGGKS